MRGFLPVFLGSILVFASSCKEHKLVLDSQKLENKQVLVCHVTDTIAIVGHAKATELNRETPKTKMENDERKEVRRMTVNRTFGMQNQGIAYHWISKAKPEMLKVPLNHELGMQIGVSTVLISELIVLAILSYFLSFSPIIFGLFLLMGLLFLVFSIISILSFNYYLEHRMVEIRNIGKQILKAGPVMTILLGVLCIISLAAFYDIAVYLLLAIIVGWSSIVILSQLFTVPDKFDIAGIANPTKEYKKWKLGKTFRLIGGTILFFGILTILLANGVLTGVMVVPLFITTLITNCIWLIPLGLILLAIGWFLGSKPNQEKRDKYPLLKLAWMLFWTMIFSLTAFLATGWLDLFFYFSDWFYTNALTMLLDYLFVGLGVAPIFLLIAVIIILLIVAFEIKKAKNVKPKE